MDIVLSLQFAGSQLLNGTINPERYYERLLEILDEATSEANTDDLMIALAKHIGRA